MYSEAEAKVRSERSKKEDPYFADLRTIHMANIVRIYDLVDKVQRNEFSSEGYVSNEITPSVFCTTETEWNFQLGDNVEIGVTFHSFKSIQKRVLAWKKTLSNVYGQPGIVVGCRSKFENAVDVYFPKILTSTALYAGVLAKKKGEMTKVVPSRWKVGQYVMTRKNSEIVKQFQTKLPDIPDDAVGKKGRVVAVTKVGIFVTFDERSSYAVNPALLIDCADQTPISIPLPVSLHEGFLVGDKVLVIRHMRKLIENQKDCGGWNWKMSALFGKPVIITDVREDRTLIVKLHNSRSWRLNYLSVYAEKNGPPLIDEDDFLFLPGDKVHVRLRENMMAHLAEAKVLASTAEFLKTTAIVIGIDENFEVVVRFNNDQNVHLDSTTLRKATKMETRRYEETETKLRSMGKGSRVRFDIGPSSYVNDILSKNKVDASVTTLLLEPSTLLHYIDEDYALISYESGKCVRVNRKYLTPAEKMASGIARRTPTLKLLELLQTKLETCVKALQLQMSSKELSDFSVDVHSVTTGEPPTVCFTVPLTSRSLRKTLESLRTITHCNVEDVAENEALVGVCPNSDEKVHLILLSQDHYELDSDFTESNNEHDQGTGMLTEASYHVSTAPNDNQNIQLKNLSDLRFLPFTTPGGTVYLAYTVPQRRSVQTTYETLRGVSVDGSAVQNNFSTSENGGNIIVNQFYN